ncbi:hypothetical protein CJ195_27255 [Bacillus sp. UMB0899]|nr:hypothetical protein CJ195_27255 [Bacillus sp. UMB0899]
MSALGQEQIVYTGKTCRRFEQNASGVKVWFEDGSTLIAADGIHSPICKKLMPNVKPRYAAGFGKI